MTLLSLVISPYDGEINEGGLILVSPPFGQSGSSARAADKVNAHIRKTINTLKVIQNLRL
jgi:hypothetical protein